MEMTEKQIPWYFTPTVVIVAGCLVAMVNFGVRSSFGLFTAPISEAHVWPREIFSFGLALQNLLWGIATRSPAPWRTVTAPPACLWWGPSSMPLVQW